jgi:hypothetical protein
MGTKSFYYRSTWQSDLWCPLGRVSTRPQFRVSAIDAETIPFRELDCLTLSIPEGTYEDAAKILAEKIQEKWGGRIRVRVSSKGLWAQWDTL